MVISLVYPYDPKESTCGYCGPPGQRSLSTFHRKSASLDALSLSCDVYQRMIDRGWRRSGTYCYKPDLRQSCCPQYTIRLDALQFKPTKSQRKILRRWNNYVLGSDDARKSSSSIPSTLVTSIHESEVGWPGSSDAKHRFETMFEPSSFTDEKYQLFKRYQEDIHHDTENTPRGFTRFLCDSPLRSEPIPYAETPPSHLPAAYGSYHQLYRLDGKLIALAVLDILPSCVSSVYFIYDKAWEKYSFGKLSAFREVSLASEINAAGASQMKFVYMGYYIHSCPKMRYKGEYSPSFLADPETYEWYPLETCMKQLDTVRYACFSFPERSTNDPPPKYLESRELTQPSDEDLQNILIVQSIEQGTHCLLVESLTDSESWVSEPHRRRALLICILGLGVETAKMVIQSTLK